MCLLKHNYGVGSCFRYRSILDAILTSSGDDLAETLKVFIEASMTCI